MSIKSNKGKMSYEVVVFADNVSLQTAIGTIYLRKHQAIQQLEQIENQLSELEVNFTQMRENEQKLLQSLEEKYGKGTIDLSSGKFTPNS